LVFPFGSQPWLPQRFYVRLWELQEGVWLAFSAFGEHVGRGKLLFLSMSRAAWGKKRREMMRSLIPYSGSC